MFEALLKSRFYTKCKSVIKLTKIRIEMIRKKREAMLKYLRNDMADLLKSGLDVNAYNRVEGLMFELNISICYGILEQYCLHISSHLAIMSKHRECPEDCREAVSTLMFAAARFSDLPELRGLRAIFTERYGNSLELFVNKEFVEKLKSQPPTKEMKFQLMRDIAVESGIKWNSRDLDKQDRPKSDNDKEHKLYKKTDESTQRKEDEDANLSLGSNRNLDDMTPIKDGIKEPDMGSCVSKEESDDKKPFYYRSSFQPNYTKSRVFITNSNSEESPIGFTREAEGHTEITQMRVQMAKKEDTNCVDDTLKKPKPKSVRRTRLQPMRGFEEDSDRLKGEEKGKGITKGDQQKMMDRLLIHYTQKQLQNEIKKPKPVSWQSPSGRAATTPIELEHASPALKVREGYTEVNSFEQDMLSPNGHIHPKLPDYDDFVTRLAALRGNFKE